VLNIADMIEVHAPASLCSRHAFTHTHTLSLSLSLSLSVLVLTPPRSCRARPPSARAGHQRLPSRFARLRCVLVCVRACVCVCVVVRACVCVCIRGCVCVRAWLCVHAWLCVCVCACVCFFLSLAYQCNTSEMLLLSPPHYPTGRARGRPLHAAVKSLWPLADAPCVPAHRHGNQDKDRPRSVSGACWLVCVCVCVCAWIQMCVPVLFV
jgi:hypothetical protein